MRNENRKQWMRNLRFVFVVGLIISAALFVVQVLPAIAGGKDDYEESWEIRMDQDTSLAVDLSNVTVRIEGISGNTLEASFSGRRGNTRKNPPEIKVLEESGQITFAERNEQSAPINLGVFSGWGLSGTLTLRVPENRLEDLEVTCFSGGIKVTGLEAETITLDSSSGEVTLENVKADGALRVDSFAGNISMRKVEAETIGVESSSGRIEARDVVADAFSANSFSGNMTLMEMDLEDLRIDTSSGKIEVALEQEADVSMETFSGRVDLTLPRGMGFTYQIETFSGGVEIGFDHTGGKEGGVVGDGDHSIRIETSSGGVKIHPAE